MTLLNSQAAASSQAIRTLAFEHAFRVEAVRCQRCAGTGQYAVDKWCMSCRALGRVLTVEGVTAYNAVCAMLAITPSVDERRRVRYEFMLSIQARYVVNGMRVRRPYAPLIWRDVVAVEEFAPSHKRLTYADGARDLFPPDFLLMRELTEDEVERADVMLAQFVGKGAVEAL
jgi:hypothetical protein